MIRILLVGVGCLAASWVRFISEDPEFSWSGTLFIVGGFAVFGLAQSVVAVARRRLARRRMLTVFRAIGGVATLPLFGAPGAVMFPTVVGAGLAIARPEWRRATRVVCAVVALGPVLFVGNDLRGSFGWSVRTVGGFVAMLALYSVVVWATRFTSRLPTRSGAPPATRGSATVTLRVTTGPGWVTFSPSLEAWRSP